MAPTPSSSLFLLLCVCLLAQWTPAVLAKPARAAFSEKNKERWMEAPRAAPQAWTADDFPSGFSMYEISTRPWLYNLSLKYEKNITRLADIPVEEFQALKDKGIDMVWMMGVWQLGQYGLNFDRTDPGLLSHYAQVLPDYKTADIIGSPYAITNYTVNSELGSEADLKALREMLHSLGLLLMLDFVPNHTAVDCEWTTTEKEYFVLAPKGTNPPYDPSTYLPSGIAYGSSGWGAWKDTAQLNYWNPATAKARLQELLYVASLSDAIRCDMAYLLLNDLIQQNWESQLSSWGWQRPSTEWWQTAIATVKEQYPNVIFLAEVYSPWEPKLQSLGFDFTYDKQLYDKLSDGNLDAIRGWLSSNSLDYITHSAHFVSNHDEQRAVAQFGSWWRADAAALITFTLPGMRFHWMGQWQGYSAPLDVHLRRERYEPANGQVMAFYSKLTSIVNDDVFKKGQWTYLNVFGADTAWRLIAYRWSYQDERRLCVINYSDTQGQGRVIVSDAQPQKNGNDTIPVTDLLSGEVFYRSAKQMRQDGLYVIVNSWFAQIFSY